MIGSDINYGATVPPTTSGVETRDQVWPSPGRAATLNPSAGGPPVGLFAKLGVLVVEGFLDPVECARVRAEMRLCPASDAKVGVRGQIEGTVNEDRRKSKVIEVLPETRSSILARLLALKPRAEQHFGVPLADDLEPPKFLIYRPGDFFRAHTDRRTAQEVGYLVTKRRRVNLIVFLNGASEEETPETFGGGGLTLYGLIDKPGWSTMGFPVIGEPGLLIAFRSEQWHEVLAVTRGERYTVVTRFLDPRPAAQSPEMPAEPESRRAETDY